MIGAGTTTFGAAELIRVGFVAAMSGVPAISLEFRARTAIDEWIGDSMVRGLSAESLVAQLNEKGHWASEEPEQGLPELISELGEQFAKFDDENLRCTMHVAAGTLSDEEKSATAQLDEAKKARPIKYCFTIVCRSLSVTEDDEVTWMVSSHSSKREGWSGSLTTTILFDEIHAPGGFCTISGDLADSYQG